MEEADQEGKGQNRKSQLLRLNPKLECTLI